ncbi:MAG: MBL fold metallo-hydrolase [Clostridium sp.]
MIITYIHHSSFSVELEQVTMLFDYYKGKLPEFSREKPLIVFASHFHADHYSPIIFTLAEDREDVFYILSSEIQKRKVPEQLLNRIRFVKAGERFFTEQGNLEIETYKSTDEGVAFWISGEGQQIYHAGDLNNWWWEGEDKAWNHNMAADYSHEIEAMAGHKADVAFLPLDPRQEQQFYLGFDEFMKKVSAEIAFPMHFWEDYSMINQIKQHPCSSTYRDHIAEIHKEGEVFYYGSGR